MSSEMIPLFVRPSGARIVVTGSGPSAVSVASRLAAAGALVRLVAPDAPEVAGCERVAATPSAAHLDGALLLVLASEDAASDRAIAEAADARPMLRVSAFGPEGRAFLGASAGDGSLAVAVTTCGQSPELESRLVRDAAATLGPNHARFAEILGGIRAKLEDRIPDAALRASVWEQILDSPVMVLLEAGSDDEAVEMAERMAWGTG